MSTLHPMLRELRPSHWLQRLQRAILSAVILVGIAAQPACAQQLTPAAAKLRDPAQAGGSSSSAALQPAAQVDPAALRQALRSIHGFTRAQLESASSDTAAVLTRLIDDPTEEMLVRRQAIKALALFPDDERFAFVAARLHSAPPGLKRLYVGTLGAFAPDRDVQVAQLLDGLLADPELTVRLAAVGVTSRIGASPRLRTLLQQRLTAEPDATVREAITSALQAR